MRKKYTEAVRLIRDGSNSLDDVAGAVSSLRKVQGGMNVPVQLIDLCLDLGFSVFLQELSDEVRGYLVIDGELKARFATDRVIVVNSEDDVKLRRFTVARALGFYLYDWNPEEIVYQCVL